MPIFPLVLPERPNTEPDHAEHYLNEIWVTCRAQMDAVGETGPTEASSGPGRSKADPHERFTHFSSPKSLAAQVRAMRLGSV